MFKSIFGRMFWTYAILLALVLISISIFMSCIFSQLILRKQIETVVSVATTLEQHTVMMQIERKDEISVQGYTQILNSWSRFTKSDILVMNRDGEVFESTCGIDSVPDEIMECIDTDEVITLKSTFNNYYDHKVISVAFPLHYKSNVIGAIIFNRHVSDLNKSVMEMMLMFLLSSCFAILIAFILVYYQAKKISAPIVEINKAARNIASGSFSERVQVTSQDEIGQLASTFNFMASSIEKSDKQRQRFISDVSHELRTPMTSISGFVQGMLDGTIDDSSRNDYLKIVLDESTRLTKLVNDMLEMSKMQSDQFRLDISEFDIVNLICTTLISLEAKIEAAQLDVNVDFRPDKLITLGDKDQIKRVLLNLIDNAVKFSYKNTTIEIKTWVEGGKAHVSVSNTGDGLSEADCKNIFDRFFKTDSSRTKDKSGAGLGLSLVQNIIRLHNEKISVKSEPSEDGASHLTTFEFTLEMK